MAQKITKDQQNIVVTSQANAGDAGGTIYYANIGGVKYCWGATASISVSGTGTAASATKAITLPTSFFSTIQQVQLSTGPATNTQYILATNIAQSTSSLQVQIVQFNGSNGAAVVNFFIVGT